MFVTSRPTVCDDGVRSTELRPEVGGREKLFILISALILMRKLSLDSDKTAAFLGTRFLFFSPRAERLPQKKAPPGSARFLKAGCNSEDEFPPRTWKIIRELVPMTLRLPFKRSLNRHQERRRKQRRGSRPTKRKNDHKKTFAIASLFF